MAKEFQDTKVFFSKLPEKPKSWTLFSTSILSQNSKKLDTGPFGEKNEKKCHNAEKQIGDPLVSSSFVCYVKKGTTFIVHLPGPKGSI